MKKLQKHKTELSSQDDIWNAVIEAIGEMDLPMEPGARKDTFLAFHYYSTMESGGHKSLLDAFFEYVQEIGAEHFLTELTTALERIGAEHYARFEREYGKEMWYQFVALEHGETDEAAFYKVIEQADQAYYELGNSLEQVLAAHFVAVHEQLIDII
ncbi:hypothetical protein [Planococcus sp. ISL-109]|uniref:hypothetical protein n=1 Tax=Planococcus sp. ISL-109 TaxID=2819166 RepID=UPI001BE96DBD|nr:hypothetical protein [Planococcus sp. ISL-109]MBT2581611.1 hypothetical protein [Planococcus sp. ISL-109]